MGDGVTIRPPLINASASLDVQHDPAAGARPQRRLQQRNRLATARLAVDVDGRRGGVELAHQSVVADVGRLVAQQIAERVARCHRHDAGRDVGVDRAVGAHGGLDRAVVERHERVVGEALERVGEVDRELAHEKARLAAGLLPERVDIFRDALGKGGAELVDREVHDAIGIVRVEKHLGTSRDDTLRIDSRIGIDGRGAQLALALAALGKRGGGRLVDVVVLELADLFGSLLLALSQKEVLPLFQLLAQHALRHRHKLLRMTHRLLGRLAVLLDHKGRKHTAFRHAQRFVVLEFQRLGGPRQLALFRAGQFGTPQPRGVREFFQQCKIYFFRKYKCMY
jgi:hypothetical protein